MKEERIDTFIGKKIKLTEKKGPIHYGVLHKIVDSKIENGDLRTINNGYFLEIEDKKGIDYRKSSIMSIKIEKESNKEVNKEADFKNTKTLRKQICNEIREKMKEMYLLSEDEFNRIITEVENNI